jgi:undecaprenyl-diphosphatase
MRALPVWFPARTWKRGSWVAAAVAALALWAFVQLSDELFGAAKNSTAVAAFDRTVIFGVASLRRGWLTSIAVDLTSFGSPTLLTLLTLSVVAVLLHARDRRGAAQMTIVAIGAGFLGTLLKNAWSRPRPDIVPRLVDVAGFSYPSGHSLGAAAIGATAAILIARRLATMPQRVTVIASVSTLIVLVGLSRVYLGVHFPSDVLGGIILGAAWSIVVALIFRPRVIAPR